MHIFKSVYVHKFDLDACSNCDPVILHHAMFFVYTIGSNDSLLSERVNIILGVNQHSCSQLFVASTGF